jgi:DNA repair protein RecO
LPVPPVLDEAVCLREWPWSETSQTVVIFCRGIGLVRGLAKGSKRPKGPYSGGIEPLTRGRTGVIVRAGTELALVTEWELLESFPSVRRSLEAHYAGLYMAELAQQSVHDHDPHPALYEALVSGLRALGDDAARAEALLRFQWAVVAETGYRPSLEAGGEEDGAYVFDPSEGGLVRSVEHAPGESGAPSGWRVRPETVRILRDLERGRSGPWPEEGVQRAGRLLAAYLRHVLGRELKTLPLVFGARLPR